LEPKGRGATGKGREMRIQGDQSKRTKAGGKGAEAKDARLMSIDEPKVGYRTGQKRRARIGSQTFGRVGEASVHLRCFRGQGGPLGRGGSSKERVCGKLEKARPEPQENRGRNASKDFRQVG